MIDARIGLDVVFDLQFFEKPEDALGAGLLEPG